MTGEPVSIRIVGDLPSVRDHPGLQHGAVLRVDSTTATALVLSGTAVHVTAD